MQSISQLSWNFPDIFGMFGMCCVLVLAVGANFATFRFFGPWPRLASTYADRSTFIGKKWRFQSMSFNYWWSYRQCVTVGINPIGLYLAPWWLVRGGRPPILIPWSALQFDPKPLWFGQVYRLRIKPYPKIKILIPRSLFKKLENENSRFPNWPDILN
jgi:hypothetical protein